MEPNSVKATCYRQGAGTAMLSRAEDTCVLMGAFACKAGDAHHSVGCFGFPHPPCAVRDSGELVIF